MKPTPALLEVQTVTATDLGHNISPSEQCLWCGSMLDVAARSRCDGALVAAELRDAQADYDAWRDAQPKHGSR